MSEMQCPHCEQMVPPTQHTPEECLNNMRRQRDEARQDLLDVLPHLGPGVQSYYYKYRDWLKKQASVDEEEG